MTKSNNQADLFDQPQKKEDTVTESDNQERQELIDKLRKMSEELKHLPGGMLHPDRLKEINQQLKP